MKIVLSPAKSLDFEKEYPKLEYSLPIFEEEAAKLNKVLAKKKPKALFQIH